MHITKRRRVWGKSMEYYFGVLWVWGFPRDFAVGVGWIWGLKSNPHGSPDKNKTSSDVKSISDLKYVDEPILSSIGS